MFAIDQLLRLSNFIIYICTKKIFLDESWFLQNWRGFCDSFCQFWKRFCSNDETEIRVNDENIDHNRNLLFRYRSFNNSVQENRNSRQDVLNQEHEINAK